MAKRQDICLLSGILCLGLNTVGIVSASASIDGNQQKSQPITLSSEYSTFAKSKSAPSYMRQTKSPLYGGVTVTSFSSNKSYQVAQNKASESTELSEQEMLDALQQRQEKIDKNLDKIKKLTGADAESSEVEQESLTEEEMIDAINQRQNKIEELKELKKLEDNLKNESMLETLQEQDFNINSIEELEAVQAIVNDPNLNQSQMLEILQQQNINVDSIKKLKQLRKIVKQKPSAAAESSGISSQMAFRMLAIGIPGTLLVFLIATPLVKGIAGTFKSNYEEKFGKPKVPEGSVNLHSRSFKEITMIGNKAEKINNDKFGNEEFLLLLRIKINMSQEAEGYQGLGNCVDLLQAGIIAQKSFLRLEQTELRYRSRKQQEFYQYVADNLGDGEDIDREAFAKKIKKKQTEVLPLITTEEGRGAIDTYVKEINVLSQYKLGLKLLALFKQY
ncbi:MAG: hypothetical protein AAF383_17430, partial [Cyanobacteria bacterium P01_A01_bin.83]